MDKAQYLKKFHADRTRWEALIAEVGEARMQAPGAMGDWTFKDLIAHLTGWRKRTVLRVEAGCGGSATDPSSWPSDVDSDSDDGVQRINELIYEENKNRPVQEVLDESRQVLQRLEEALQDLLDEAFNDPDCFEWIEGKPLAEADILGHWHEEHEPAVREWLNASGSKPSDSQSKAETLGI